MSLRSKAREIQSIFFEVDEQNLLLKSKSGLACISGCGKCCDNPKIMAYPAEFLPFSLYLLKRKQIQEFLDELEHSNNELCPIFKPSFQGSCTEYYHRGLICRVFGYGAQRNKEGNARLITCKLLKDAQPEEVKTAETIFREAEFEYASTFYDRLKLIAPSLTTEIYPIKKAIKVAIEYTMQHSFYENLSDDHSNFEDEETSQSA